ncbi:MAG: GNAT family N-acetyltransferase [Paracoccaceae bacterium]
MDIQPLILLWHRCWHEAHATILPPALVALRTPETFAKRLESAGDRLRVAGPEGEPLGLCSIKDDQIDQLYVAKQARGHGLAAALLHDGEDHLRAAGVTDAFLECAALNHRAIRFYTREGWRPLRENKVPATAVDPPILIDVILFAKRLTDDITPALDRH